MRIVVAIDVTLKENNGTSVAAMNLIRSLGAAGHEVRVISTDPDTAGQEGYFVAKAINFGFLNGYVAKNGVSIARAKANRALLEQALDGADALHILTPFFLCTAALQIAREKGISVTAGFHCQAENILSHFFLMNARWAEHLVYRILYRKVYRYVDCIHYPTQFIRDVFEKECGHKTNGRVISNGVGDRFRPGHAEKPANLENRYVILFTGRYSKEKSHRVLIDAVAGSRYADKIQLIFAGSGPQKTALEKYAARRLPIPPQFRFFSREGLLDVIHYADLYVHPAEIEIEAIACLEAISCGLVPVIANSPRCATKTFALDERNLFRCGDPEDLKDKIDYWLDHPAEKEARSRDYQGYTARFAQSACMEEMEQMIRETAAAKQREKPEMPAI